MSDFWLDMKTYSSFPRFHFCFFFFKHYSQCKVLATKLLALQDMQLTCIRDLDINDFYKPKKTSSLLASYPIQLSTPFPSSIGITSAPKMLKQPCIFMQAKLFRFELKNKKLKK